jgi:hypothetical protein
VVNLELDELGHLISYFPVRSYFEGFNRSGKSPRWRNDLILIKTQHSVFHGDYLLYINSLTSQSLTRLSFPSSISSRSRTTPKIQPHRNSVLASD